MAKGLFDLSGKLSVVTGANSGLGLGFARGIAKQGGDVEIWARNAEKNAKAKAEQGAMGAVVRSMASEFGKHQIRVNTVAPGFIMTDFMDTPQAAQIEAFFSARTPIPRAGRPEDFEAIAAYLASDASSFHTGDTIVI